MRVSLSWGAAGPGRSAPASRRPGRCPGEPSHRAVQVHSRTEPAFLCRRLEVLGVAANSRADPGRRLEAGPRRRRTFHSKGGRIRAASADAEVPGPRPLEVGLVRAAGRPCRGGRRGPRPRKSAHRAVTVSRRVECRSPCVSGGCPGSRSEVGSSRGAGACWSRPSRSWGAGRPGVGAVAGSAERLLLLALTPLRSHRPAVIRCTTWDGLRPTLHQHRGAVKAVDPGYGRRAPDPPHPPRPVTARGVRAATARWC